MDSEFLWNCFTESGSIKDYIKYKNSLNSQKD
jgi:hypothetical protein